MEKRKCKQTDQRGDECLGYQILRDDAEEPFSRARYLGQNEACSTPVKRRGWQCENGHFDEAETLAELDRSVTLKKEKPRFPSGLR
jgi:hypothetical protein